MLGNTKECVGESSGYTLYGEITRSLTRSSTVNIEFREKETTAILTGDHWVGQYQKPQLFVPNNDKDSI